MIDRGMKLLIPARHGLGDVLNGYFIAERGRTILARVKTGLETGRIASAMVVYEHCYTPGVGELFRALPFDLIVKRTSELPEVNDQEGDNRMPDAVRWHQNVYTNPPAGFEELDGSTWVDCPTRRPAVDLPDDFLLFSDAATAPDRRLTDHAIYSFLREVTGLPVVKVGQGHDVVPSDLNLCGKLSIVETLFVASRARIVVSALTMLRTFSGLFGIPVIELAERPSPQTVRRTRGEYDGWQYGMRPSLNKWFFWPNDRTKIAESLCALGGVHRD
jgi:hypothetical protein